MKIFIITGDHTKPDPEKYTGHYLEEDLKIHQAMVEVFNHFEGMDVTVINDHSALLQTLKEHPPELVVNFCDTGFKNNILLELHIPAFLELLNIPYTGANPASIAMVYDKAMVRLLAQAMGIPVPEEIFLKADETLNESQWRFPALIKPNCADGSLGITKDAVVYNRAQADHYLHWLHESLPGRDLLIQEFLSGQEYGVGLIGNVEEGLEALPILEVDYSALPSGLNPILSYESKAIPNSPYWSCIQYQPARITSKEKAAMIDWSKQLFGRLGLRDYGRFDFRRDRDGVIKLMEVNPNPAWGNDGKLAIMAGFADMPYSELLYKILLAACQRLHLPCPEIRSFQS